MQYSAEQRADDGLGALDAALAAVGIGLGGSGAGGGGGATLAVTVDDRPLVLHVAVRSYCTGSAARELIWRAMERVDGALPVVVADKITVEARDLLTDAGWSWLDRRGRLHLRGPGVRVDADVPAEERNVGGGQGAPIAGRGGIAVAYWLCAHRGRAPSPTRDARALEVAPSTVSTAMHRLAAAGLVDPDGAGLFPELFFELAAVWPRERAWVATAPEPEANRTAGPSWRRTGTAAAAAYGAPVVTVSGGPVELYVARSVEVITAVRRYGAAAPGTGAASLAVAPTPTVLDGAGDDERVDVDGWPLAPAVAVALDLAQDRGRGRAILEKWAHDDAVWR